MKKEEIIEGNRLINGFMGYPYNEYAYPLEYHKDWNLLMSVVEKIAETNRYAIIDEIPEDEWWVYAYLIHLKITTSILSVWQAVVEYIKWYNENETRKNNS